jgi:hypothetical protein
MYEAGVDKETISLILGHKPAVDKGTQVASDHYIWVRDEVTQGRMKEAVEKFYTRVGSMFEEHIQLTHLKRK